MVYMFKKVKILEISFLRQHVQIFADNVKLVGWFVELRLFVFITMIYNILFLGRTFGGKLLAHGVHFLC